MDAAPTANYAADLLDPSGTIAAETACRRCGYNLRGLTPEGLCPECGTPIGLSISGDLLRFSDPDWLDRLVLGIRYILWGVALDVILSVCAAMLPTFGNIIALIGGLLAVYGAWLLTEPDPSGLGEERYANARKVIRITLLIGLIGETLSIFLEAGALPPLLLLVLVIVMVLASLAGLVGQFAQLMYLETLALRIPEPEYAGRARFLKWAFGLSLLVMILAGAGILAMSAATTPSGAGFVGLSCFAAVAGLGLLIFGLLYLRLLYRMGQAIREQATLARQLWKQAAAAQG